MLKKFLLFFLPMILAGGILKSQVPDPVLLPGEYWTSLFSAAYDYQTNGSIRYIVQDPTNPLNLCVILMAQEDSSVTTAAQERLVYYAYSDDGGLTWAKAPVVTTEGVGFPSIALRNGNPIIGFHISGTVGSVVYEDAVFGGFSFAQVGSLPTTGPSSPPIWPHVTGTQNGNIVIAAAPNPGFIGYFSTYTGTTWTDWTEINQVSGPSGNFSVEANPMGPEVAIFGSNYNSNYENGFYLSNNNGVTFSLQSMPEYFVDGSDTLFMTIDGGKQTTFINNEPHVFFSVYSASFSAGTLGINFVNSRIYQWSPSGGLKFVAGKSNIPNLCDTINTALMTPVCQPTITRYSNGTLALAFTAFLWGNTQVVDDGSILNAGEIFITRSADNGTTWTTPENITNTPNIEEKHSSFVRYPQGDMSGLVYLRDLKAGGWVNVSTWGKAPVYSIYRTISKVGISNELQTVNSYTLFQNYPNPFNPTTTISYYIQKTGLVTLKVYDVMGREVRTLVNEVQTIGAKEFTFDASSLSSGIYYYTLTSGNFKDTKKMMLIK
jgi:hypothetical protein